MILISKYLQLQNQTTIQSLHAKKKKNLVKKKFVKNRKDHIFVSFRVFLFHGNIIFSELSYK